MRKSRPGTRYRERALDWRLKIQIREVNQLATGSGLSIAVLLGVSGLSRPIDHFLSVSICEFAADQPDQIEKQCNPEKN